MIVKFYNYKFYNWIFKIELEKFKESMFLKKTIIAKVY